MLIDSFLGYLRFEKACSEKTIQSYGKDLRQFEAFLKENVDKEHSLEQTDADMIREWVSLLMDMGFTSTSVNRKLSSLRSFFKYLIKKNIVTIDPTKKITGPKNKKVLPVFVREDEINRLLDDVEFEEGFVGVRDKAIIETFYLTGIRLSELISIKDVDVDFYSQTVKVTGKRNKQRIIPFDDELRKTLLEYINVRNEVVVSQNNGFLFVKETGECLNKDIVYRVVKKNLSKVVTLKKRSPHVLRHSFATALLNNSAELGAVKELLGHVNIATTELYTHTTFEELKKAYSKAHPRS
ncbi:MAG: tyrosine-type recombinase/integrase [Bacteroides sp.]|nr:tyrosine-type recombinase/integrase [Bacteroides sp.]